MLGTFISEIFQEERCIHYPFCRKTLRTARTGCLRERGTGSTGIMPMYVDYALMIKIIVYMFTDIF